MKTRTLRTILAIGTILICFIVPVLSVNSHFASINSTHFSGLATNIQEPIDMLIFISPQYANDREIKTATEIYTAAVKDDINWNTKIITITQEDNDFRKIDRTIEKYYELYEIKACIMVGEDTDTALGGDYDYMEKLSTVPWFTTGGEDTYKTSAQGIICKPYKMDICISVLYPTTNDLDYETKKSQIIFAFKKFSNQRHIYSINDITVLESSDININSKEMYLDMGNLGSLYYYEDPSNSEISRSLSESHSMYFVHGHSNPAGTKANAQEDVWFSADNVDQLDTQLFGADGCYVGGWWSNQLDNNKLDSSIDCLWYGSKIFTSKYVQAMVLGLLSQNGYSYPVSFIENAVPDLLQGATLAESMIGDVYLGDTVLIGDPTLYFT